MKKIIFIFTLLFVFSACSNDEKQKPFNSDDYIGTDIVTENINDDVNKPTENINTQQGDEIVPKTFVERREQAILRQEEDKQNNFNFILDGIDYIPAEAGKNVDEIDKVLYREIRGNAGKSFLIDITNNEYAVNKYLSSAADKRNLKQFDLTEEDISKLKEVINDSNMQNWEEKYKFSESYDEPGAIYWELGILYKDGSIERHYGSFEDNKISKPPKEEFDIFVKYKDDLINSISDEDAKPLSW